jgi:hypothetical protein
MLQNLTKPNPTDFRISPKVNSPHKSFPILAILLALSLFSPKKALGQSDGNSGIGVDLPLVDPTNVPPFATFYSLSTFGVSFENSFGPPLPWNPCPECDTYYLGSNGAFFSFSTNAYVVDDTSILAANGASQMTTQDPPPIPGGDSGNGDDPGVPGPQAAYSYPSNYLWLSIEAVSNNTAFVTAHGTVADQVYELMSRERLTDTNWVSEGQFIGSENQTATTVAVGTRTNSLFIWARSWADDDGDGLPSWWELQYGLDPYNADTGNTGVLDGYKIMAGDGWNNLYKYQHRMNPNQSYPPPPPQRVSARLDSTGTNVILTWDSGGGPVASYGIEAPCGYYPQSEITTVSSSTFTRTVPAGPWFLGWWDDGPCYQVRAYFTDGTHADSAQVRIANPDLTINGTILRGPSGQPFLAISPIPASAARIRVVSWDNSFNNPIPWVDLYPSNFVNGIAPLPAIGFDNYLSWCLVQVVGTGGDFSQTTSIYPYYADEDNGWLFPATNFVNSALHMKENLKFLLRSATLTQPFSYSSGLATQGSTDSAPDDFQFQDEQLWYAREPGSIDYQYYGFHTFSSNLNYSFMEETRPVVENYLWRNFVYDPADYGQFGLTNGSFFWSSLPTMRALAFPMTHRFASSFSGPLPLAFSTTNSPYLLSGWLPDPDLWAGEDYDMALEQGLAVNTNSGFAAYLPSGTRNLFGLPIAGLLSATDSSQSPVLFPAGGSATQTTWSDSYLSTVNPGLQTVGYYFASQTPYFRYIHEPWQYGQTNPTPPFPGSPGFSVTNTSPLLFASVGQPITFAGWAKMAITNGAAEKYAYLEQYWDKAYKIATNGDITANATGVLSPYGEFFPTEPGPTALKTIPDTDTGEQGTAIVNVLKLQLDVNHDGTMDLSYGGPDNTTQDRPFTFWANNDFDRGHTVDFVDFEEDDLKTAKSPATFGETPDCDYQVPPGEFAIPSKRDLEDYTRLWIPGLRKLYEAHTNLIFELSIRNNDRQDGPAINLVLAVESNGGTKYLTDTNYANDQISFPGLKSLGRISPTSKIRLNNFFNYALYPGTGAENFIWCGARRGKGELVLQIKSGTNLLVETSTWIQIKDIKEMYERYTCGDAPNKPPTNNVYLATEGLPDSVTPFRYPTGTTNTPYILFVHGWNMDTDSKDRFAETAFKRFYWQGYQGRFGLFRWPTLYAFPAGEISFQAFNPDNFDTTEFASWRSGTPLRNLLVQLNNQYPSQVRMFAHSHGNIAAGEALRTNVTLVHTYIGMQAAVASHAYDPTATNRSLGVWPVESYTPERTAQYWTNGAPCYFNGITGAAHFVNFYNFNDWALGWWLTDQNLKPDLGYSWTAQNNAPELYYYQNSPSSSRQLLFPQDTFEIFSYITEGRCYAVGQQANLAGVFDPANQINLAAPPYNVDDTHKGHSAEFRSHNMARGPIWDMALRRMGLK